jgi:hypothetical protein
MPVEHHMPGPSVWAPSWALQVLNEVHANECVSGPIDWDPGLKL